jgi:hypothetical protein
MGLALLHDAFSDPVVRQLLERLGIYAGRFGSTRDTAYEFGAVMAISKIITAIFMLLFRRQDRAA